MVDSGTSFIQKFNYFRKQRFFKYGIPFFTLLVAGSFGLREFSQLRYFKYKKNKTYYKKVLGINFLVFLL